MPSTDLPNQLHRALLRRIIGPPQLPTEGKGEAGFLHGFDLVQDLFGGSFGLLFFL